MRGEHALPVLDAAHVQSYLGPASNHLQNALVLRGDLHRLIDGGDVAVTPDHRFQVSQRLKDEFENGHAYYALDGTKLVVLPCEPEERLSRQGLEWQASNVFSRKKETFCARPRMLLLRRILVGVRVEFYCRG